MQDLAACYQNQQKYAEAEKVYGDLLEARGRKSGPDDPATLTTMQLLGACLVAEKKYAEAEPLLISSYKGLKDRENKLPPSLKPSVPEAAERIVQLYEAWGKTEKASEWRKKLSSSSPSPPAGAPKS